MTENEAIEYFKDENEQCYEECEGECSDVENGKCTCRDGLILSMLQEIQQYRLIGTVEKCNAYKRIAETTFCSACLDMKIIDELHEYRNVGTVEECREAVERQRAKKPEFEMNFGDYESRFSCECGKKIVVRHDRGVMDNNDAPNYCLNCGQKLDWGDTT